jgi:hypothetical protein
MGSTIREERLRSPDRYRYIADVGRVQSEESAASTFKVKRDSTGLRVRSAGFDTADRSIWFLCFMGQCTTRIPVKRRFKSLQQENDQRRGASKTIYLKQVRATKITK